jgi:hypothetical protein
LTAINYLYTVARRTHENFPVALTLLIQTGAEHGDITQPHPQKFFHGLAASPFTFTDLAVDRELRLTRDGSADWSQVNNAAAYRFYPEFLHPIKSVMSDPVLASHLTPRGDLVLFNRWRRSGTVHVVSSKILMACTPRNRGDDPRRRK